MYAPECDNSPCLNNETCVPNSSPRGYLCECPDAEKFGPNCEPKSKCADASCAPDAVCVEVADGYKCICVDGQPCGSQTSGFTDRLAGSSTAFPTTVQPVQYNVVLRLRIDYRRDLSSDQAFRALFINQVRTGSFFHFLSE